MQRGHIMSRTEDFHKSPQRTGVRKPLIASLLSWLEPGLGFIYNGELKKGVVLTIAFIGLEGVLLRFAGRLSPLSCLAAVCAILVARIAFIIYAASRAKKLGRVALNWYNRGLVYVVYVLLVGMMSVVLWPRLPIRSFVMAATSMNPTFDVGDRILVDPLAYQDASPHPGEIIAFLYPKDTTAIYVKRCAAVGGQTLAIRQGIVYVNNEPFMPNLVIKRNRVKLADSTYVDPNIVPQGAGNEDYYGPVIVPRDSIFVLGDFRDNSLDSRHFGFVNSTSVIGKVWLIYWSRDLSKIGTVVD